MNHKGQEPYQDEQTTDAYYEPIVVTDGGNDLTAHISDQTIAEAIDAIGDPNHPDTLSVEEVRELLAFIQRGVEIHWSGWMDDIENRHSGVVHEDNEVVILSTGQDNSVARDLDYYDGEIKIDKISKQVVTTIHRKFANERCDYDWSVTYPYVMAKPESFNAGQQYVEAVINSLQKRGLSPGQAWAVYGTKIRGNTQSSWATRCGYSDHSPVGNAVRKAEKKIPLPY